MLFAVYLLVIRNTRAAVGVVAGFVGSVLLGFAILPSTWDYWTSKLRDPDRVGTPLTPGNQSIRGLLANLSHTNGPTGCCGSCWCWWGFTLGIGAAVVAHRAGQELLALSLVGMTSCAISPMAWGHHWVWFVPLAVVALNWISDAGRSASRASSSESWSSAGSWRRSRGGRTWVTRHGSSTRRATMRT